MDNLTRLPPELLLRVVELLLEPQQTLTAYQCRCGSTRFKERSWLALARTNKHYYGIVKGKPCLARLCIYYNDSTICDSEAGCMYTRGQGHCLLWPGLLPCYRDTLRYMS